LPKTAATGKSPANLKAGSSAAFFSIDPVHGLGLAIEASDLHKARRKQQTTQKALAKPRQQDCSATAQAQ
jgi:hypothetical protein